MNDEEENQLTDDYQDRREVRYNPRLNSLRPRKRCPFCGSSELHGLGYSNYLCKRCGQRYHVTESRPQKTRIMHRHEDSEGDDE